LTTTFVISDSIPQNASYVPSSATGGLIYDPAKNVLTNTIGLGPPKVSLIPETLYGYISLPDIVVDPPFVPQACPENNCDNAAIALTGFDFYFYGQHVTDLIWVTNGYIQVGTEISSLAGTNQDLPDPAPPNNLIAPLWTDLDLESCTSDSGDMGWYRGFVTDGTYDYYVFEWKEAALKSDPKACFSIQLWIKRGSDDIWFVYGPQTETIYTATVGIENLNGSAGFTYFYNGAGAVPTNGTSLKVNSEIDQANFSYTLEIGNDYLTDVVNLAEATNTLTGEVTRASTTIQVGERIYLPLLYRSMLPTLR
jgi:hypothetical protein